MEYDKIYFWDYVKRVCLQMTARNIKYNQKYLNEIAEWCEIHSYIMRPDILNYPEHNSRYLHQCYYNLQEKYDRGIITEKEYNEILNTVTVCLNSSVQQIKELL